MENNVFYYKGNNITLKKENGNVYVNATEMAKSFNKRTNDWLSTKQANELISSLSVVTGIPATGLVAVNQGGINQGTWMHEDVALLFAQWLSPDFYILCNSKIKELLKQGYTTLDNINRKELARMILEQEEEKEKLQLKIRAQSEQIAREAPKVLFASAYETSAQSCLVGELAKVLKQNGINIGQNRLFEWLRQNGYLCTRGESYNQPTQYSMDLSLFEIKKRTLNNPDGSVRVTLTPVVTPKGQIYFIDKFLNKENLIPA